MEEFSYRKHHHYLTVVVDYDRPRVVWAGEERNARTLHAFFDGLGPDGCVQIALVTAHLVADYRQAVRARVPHARVVFDRFHVERLATDALDEIRRAEPRALAPGAAKTPKGIHYPLLKRAARLEPIEARRRATLRLQNRALDRAYDLKEYLATILEQAPATEAAAFLDQWLASEALHPGRSEHPRTCRGHPRLLGHAHDQRAGRGHQQQAARHRTARVRLSHLRPPHRDAVSPPWRHRIGAASTHTSLRRLKNIFRALSDGDPRRALVVQANNHDKTSSNRNGSGYSRGDRRGDRGSHAGSARSS